MSIMSYADWVTNVPISSQLLQVKPERHIFDRIAHRNITRPCMWLTAYPCTEVSVTRSLSASSHRQRYHLVTEYHVTLQALESLFMTIIDNNNSITLHSAESVLRCFNVSCDNFRHLGFVKFKFLTVGKVKRPILHQRTKFRKDRSNRCRDIAIYVIFRMAAADILDFQKFKILTVDPLPGANMRHHAKLHQNQSNCCRDIAI